MLSVFAFCGCFPHAMRMLMGVGFKQVAEMMLLKLQCYWLNL